MTAAKYCVTWTIALTFATKLHAPYDWTTGALDNGNDWRKFRAVPRLYPLRSLVCTLFSKRGRRGAFRLPGACGDHFHCTVEPSPGHIRCRKKNYCGDTPELEAKMAHKAWIREGLNREVQTVKEALSTPKIPVFQFTICTSWFARPWLVESTPSPNSQLHTLCKSAQIWAFLNGVLAGQCTDTHRKALNLQKPWPSTCRIEKPRNPENRRKTRQNMGKSNFLPIFGLFCPFFANFSPISWISRFFYSVNGQGFRNAKLTKIPEK